MNTPNGFTKVQAWEVFIKGKEIVILGDANSVESHNCDEMGCGSLDHVIYRGIITKGGEIRDAELPLERNSSIHGAEKNYNTESLIENLENALINGYKTLGDTDIGDLLLMCEAKEGAE